MYKNTFHKSQIDKPLQANDPVLHPLSADSCWQTSLYDDGKLVNFSAVFHSKQTQLKLTTENVLLTTSKPIFLPKTPQRRQSPWSPCKASFSFFSRKKAPVLTACMKLDCNSQIFSDSTDDWENWISLRKTMTRACTAQCTPLLLMHYLGKNREAKKWHQWGSRCVDPGVRFNRYCSRWRKCTTGLKSSAAGWLLWGRTI